MELSGVARPAEMRRVVAGSRDLAADSSGRRAPLDGRAMAAERAEKAERAERAEKAERPERARQAGNADLPAVRTVGIAAGLASALLVGLSLAGCGATDRDTTVDAAGPPASGAPEIGATVDEDGFRPPESVSDSIAGLAVDWPAGPGEPAADDGAGNDSSTDSATDPGSDPAAERPWEPAAAPGIAADPAAWRPLAPEVIGRRGGVLLIPVGAADDAWPEDSAPRSLAVSIGSRAVTGRLAAIRPPVVPDWGPSGWTDVLPRVTVTADLRPAGPDAPPPPVVLLVDAPVYADGDLMIGETSVTMRWAGISTAQRRATLAPGDDAASILPRVAAADRPDAQDPHEYWRWRLLARELGQIAPEPAGLPLTRQYARALADSWDAGLARLERADAAVARDVRELLILRVEGPAGPVAAWPTRSADLDALLQRLLDVDRPLARVASDADAWRRTIPPMPIWRASTGSTGNGHVAFMALNRSAQPQSIVVSWPEAGSGTASIVVPPRRLERVEVRRAGGDPPNGFAETAPPVPAVDGTVTEVPLVRLASGVEVTDRFSTGGFAVGGDRGPRLQAQWPGDQFGVDPGDTQLLRIRTAEQAPLDMPWDPALVPARPPGVDLRVRPELTLADVDRGAQVNVLAGTGRGAEARIRRRAGAWECFVEVRRPAGDATLARLHFGRPGAGWTLDIPERGEIGLLRDAAAMDTLGASATPPDVRRTSWSDRWYARVVLPDEWLVLGRMAVALELLPAGRPDLRLVAPGPIDPGRDAVGRVHIDLAVWDEG